MHKHLPQSIDIGGCEDIEKGCQELPAFGADKQHRCRMNQAEHKHAPVAPWAFPASGHIRIPWKESVVK